MLFYSLFVITMSMVTFFWLWKADSQLKCMLTRKYLIVHWDVNEPSQPYHVNIQRFHNKHMLFYHFVSLTLESNLVDSRESVLQYHFMHTLMCNVFFVICGLTCMSDGRYPIGLTFWHWEHAAFLFPLCVILNVQPFSR